MTTFRQAFDELIHTSERLATFAEAHPKDYVRVRLTTHDGRESFGSFVIPTSVIAHTMAKGLHAFSIMGKIVGDAGLDSEMRLHLEEEENGDFT